MGITTDEFFENIYSVIFSPKAFFERENINVSTRLAIATVAFVAILNKAAMGVFSASILKLSFIFSLIWHVILILFLWFITALFFEYIAKIFDRGGNLSKLLFYTAFVPVPYIFFGPLDIIKHIGGFGYFIGSVTELLLYFWIIALYAFALRATYKITMARAFMTIFLPFISVFFASIWAVCFCSKLWYIFTI